MSALRAGIRSPLCTHGPPACALSGEGRTPGRSPAFRKVFTGFLHKNTQHFLRKMNYFLHEIFISPTWPGREEAPYLHGIFKPFRVCARARQITVDGVPGPASGGSFVRSR